MGTARCAEIRVVVTYHHRDGRTLHFYPVSNVPGFSHRVIIDDVPFSWLSSDCKPSKKTAKFFFDEHTTRKGVKA